MGLAPGVRALNRMDKRNGGGGAEEVNSEALLVIPVPHSRVLKIMSRFLFLAVVLVTLPCIVSIFRGPSTPYIDSYEFINGADCVDFDSVPLLLRDLIHEGLIRKGDRALIFSSSIGESIHDMGFLDDNDIEIAHEHDLKHWGWIPNVQFDLVFMSSSQDVKLVDPFIKIGGILALQLNNIFQEIPNYQIVYVRQFNSTIVAMRKSVEENEEVNFSTKKGPCAMAFDTKKMAAMMGLEDALLEPASVKSREYIKKINFLPDLLGDSLEGYERRMFINIGLEEEIGAAMDWFYHNYPKRNQDFFIYNLETETNVGISDWLMENVGEEDFVVMKARAGMVEEMMADRTVCLVDELFLECNHKKREGKKNEKSAYWECLALYGRLRDEGVAVHQWWA